MHLNIKANRKRHLMLERGIKSWSSFLQSMLRSWRTTSLGLADPNGFVFCFWIWCGWAWAWASSSSFSTSSAHEKAVNPYLLSLSISFSLFLASTAIQPFEFQKLERVVLLPLVRDRIYMKYIFKIASCSYSI